jgi:hypothetical protein
MEENLFIVSDPECNVINKRLYETRSKDYKRLDKQVVFSATIEEMEKHVREALSKNQENSAREIWVKQLNRDLVAFADFKKQFFEMLEKDLNQEAMEASAEIASTPTTTTTTTTPITPVNTVSNSLTFFSSPAAERVHLTKKERREQTRLNQAALAEQARVKEAERQARIQLAEIKKEKVKKYAEEKRADVVDFCKLGHGRKKVNMIFPVEDKDEEYKISLPIVKQQMDYYLDHINDFHREKKGISVFFTMMKKYRNHFFEILCSDIEKYMKLFPIALLEKNRDIFDQLVKWDCENNTCYIIYFLFTQLSPLDDKEPSCLLEWLIETEELMAFQEGVDFIGEKVSNSQPFLRLVLDKLTAPLHSKEGSISLLHRLFQTKYGRVFLYSLFHVHPYLFHRMTPAILFDSYLRDEGTKYPLIYEILASPVGVTFLDILSTHNGEFRKIPWKKWYTRSAAEVPLIYQTRGDMLRFEYQQKYEKQKNEATFEVCYQQIWDESPTQNKKELSKKLDLLCGFKPIKNLNDLLEDDPSVLEENEIESVRKQFDDIKKEYDEANRLALMVFGCPPEKQFNLLKLFLTQDPLRRFFTVPLFNGASLFCNLLSLSNFDCFLEENKALFVSIFKPESLKFEYKGFTISQIILHQIGQAPDSLKEKLFEILKEYNVLSLLEEARSEESVQPRRCMGGTM